MKKLLLILLPLSMFVLGFKLVNSTVNYSTYSKVSDESKVEWKAWHLGKTGERYGIVKLKSGKLNLKDGKLYSGKFIMDILNLTVENFDDDNNEKLMDHLNSMDFFMTDEFPTAKFEITNATPIEGEYNYLLEGNLLIKNVNKNIQFNVNVIQTEKEISLVSEYFEVDRTDWGLNYHTESSVGIPVDYLIANEIAFKIHLKLTK